MQTLNLASSFEVPYDVLENKVRLARPFFKRCSILSVLVQGQFLGIVSQIGIVMVHSLVGFDDMVSAYATR